MNKMADSMEHSPGSFELFGFDFVIDERLKCWLIEANMSPACAPRKGQQWLQEMVEDMSDGMVNIVEHKVLRQMVSHKIDFNGPVKAKLEEVRTNTFTIDQKNWEKIEFEQKKAKIKDNKMFRETKLKLTF